MKAAGSGQRWRFDAAVTLAAAALLLLWDASGLDLAAARAFGSAGGFALRDAWWASRLLHDGGRALSFTVLALLVLLACRTPAPGAPSRARQAGWIGVILLTALLVPAIKRASATSCPWDLAEFGGSARHVSHWLWGLADGGSGACFPSGHAVSAFAFFGLYFLWRDHAPRAARALLAGVLIAGALFGAAQLVRGAHYPSHTLWSAWLCWLIALLAAHVARPSAGRKPPQTTATMTR